MFVNRAVAEFLWTVQWQNICEQSSRGMFVNRAVAESLWTHWCNLGSYHLLLLSSCLSKSVCFFLDMFVQKLNESCILKNMSVPVTKLFQWYKKQNSGTKSYLRGWNKANSRNVVCNTFGTFSAVYIEGAKSHISAVKIESNPTITDLQWPRGLQEVKVPRLHDNSTGWW